MVEEGGKRCHGDASAYVFLCRSFCSFDSVAEVFFYLLLKSAPGHRRQKGEHATENRTN